MSVRVAMIGACPYPVPQGSQVLLRDTALGLSRRGHDVHLVVYGYGQGEDTSGLPLHRCMRIPGARKTAAGPSLVKPLHDWALTVTLRRVVRARGIQVVHAHNYEGLLVSLASGVRPIVYHAHNALADELPQYFGGAAWALGLGSKLDRELPRRADHVIAPHERLADYLMSCGCDRSAISVIAPSMEPWSAGESAASEETPPVVYAGNLDTYQNLPFLLGVMNTVRRVKPEARLRVVTAQLGIVPGAEMVYAADFEAVRSELAGDCVVVCPRVSWSGYPIKLLNAMAAGKAIVVCSSAAYPLEPGRTGMVVEDNDTDGFAAAIVQLLNDSELRSRLGANARDALTRNHDPGETAGEIEAIYSRLLDRG